MGLLDIFSTEGLVALNLVLVVCTGVVAGFNYWGIYGTCHEFSSDVASFVDGTLQSFMLGTFIACCLATCALLFVFVNMEMDVFLGTPMHIFRGLLVVTMWLVGAGGVFLYESCASKSSDSAMEAGYIMSWVVVVLGLVAVVNFAMPFVRKYQARHRALAQQRAFVLATMQAQAQAQAHAQPRTQSQTQAAPTS